MPISTLTELGLVATYRVDNRHSFFYSVLPQSLHFARIPSFNIDDNLWSALKIELNVFSSTYEEIPRYDLKKLNEEGIHFLSRVYALADEL